MPLDRFVLILVIAIAAAGATIWLGAVVSASFVATPVAALALIPALLILYLLWRVLSDRLRNSEDDHYDRIDR
ncbi:hypothetical protein EKE94_14535 [Mesobaculum littorinae]|uniref:Uncharacterized protein n=1 Tax=Mesobaculum littorinae TaxID=2486419 RepID=A0A438AEU8_9RHOB|nr:hypothetical protein [Mesobaculum littorinae]RVV97231.1 hypothetical protein EKE94_14535 [Mesobaculum littorinae]